MSEPTPTPEAPSRGQTLCMLLLAAILFIFVPILYDTTQGEDFAREKCQDTVMVLKDPSRMQDCIDSTISAGWFLTILSATMGTSTAGLVIIQVIRAGYLTWQDG